jgi:hypothetical protein
MDTWFKNERITNKLKQYWNDGVVTKRIAKNLNKEFKTQITDSMVRGQVKSLGLKNRKVRGSNKPKKVAVEAPEKPKPKVGQKPTLAYVPPSRFVDKPTEKSVGW